MSDVSKRLFFAADLPEETRAAAGRLIKSLGMEPGHISWTRPENMHLTIKFLGETEEPGIPGITEAAGRALAPFGPMNLSIEGLGVFPNHDRPRVLWLGVKGDTGALASVESALSRELVALGFPPDERPFTAHLTIGRVKSMSVRGKIARLVRERSREYVGAAPVDEITLYESRLGPEGAIYTALRRFPLEGGE